MDIHVRKNVVRNVLDRVKNVKNIETLKIKEDRKKSKNVPNKIMEHKLDDTMNCRVTKWIDSASQHTAKCYEVKVMVQKN